MTREENITAILRSYFSGFKDELIEGAVNRIMALRDAEGDYFKKEDVIREIALIPVETDYEYDDEGYKKFPFRTCDYDDVMRTVTNLPTYAMHVKKKRRMAKNVRPIRRRG